MTEINNNLSVNGLSFEGLKRSKKGAQEQVDSAKVETKETDLDKMPGATYGRVGITNKKGKYGLPVETEKCVEKTVQSFKGHPDRYVIKDMVYKNAYDNAINSGSDHEEACEIAAQEAEDFMSDVEDDE